MHEFYLLLSGGELVLVLASAVVWIVVTVPCCSTLTTCCGHLQQHHANPNAGMLSVVASQSCRHPSRIPLIPLQVPVPDQDISAMRNLVGTEQARCTIMAALERGSKGSVSVYELGMSIPADVDLLEYIKSILGTAPILSCPSQCCFYPRYMAQ
jgi:hypothetical protein